MISGAKVFGARILAGGVFAAAVLVWRVGLDFVGDAAGRFWVDLGLVIILI